MTTAPTFNPRTIGVLRESTLADLRAMRKSAPNDPKLERLEAAATGFYQGLAKLDADLRDVQTDPHLTAEGKTARAAEVLASWSEASAAQVAAAEAAARDLAGEIRPPEVRPPVDDPVLLEAKLANARSDARMLLDGVAPAQLPRRMRELVEHDADPMVSYLLVATEWGTNYIRSRAQRSDNVRGGAAGQNVAHGPLIEWAHARADLMPRLLDDRGRREWDRRQRYAAASHIPAVLRETRAYTIRSRRF
jgi:hypothetical protein